MNTKQIVFNDGAGDGEDGEIVIDYGLHEGGQVWISLENVDGEFTCFMSKEQWAVLRTAIDELFNHGG